jgi:RND family efflux transporter MFP subunit
MKPILQFVTAVLTAATLLSLAHCGSAEASNNRLDQLVVKRDSLRSVINDLNNELVVIEAAIAAQSDDDDYVRVSAVSMKPQPFSHYFTVQGNIETELNALVYPESQGLIKRILVNEGDRVSKGQALMVLDTELIQRNIDEVETQYALAVDVYNRQARLWEQNIGSELQYLEAKNNKERLENTLSTLGKQKNMGTVKAPFDGVIDQISPKVGEMASMAMPVARIVSLEQMYARSQVSENYVNVVKPGMPAELILPGGDTVRTSVRRVGKFINPENRTFEITLDLAEGVVAKPNMYCAVRIEDLSLDSVIVVRSSMIMQDTQNREYLYVLRADGGNYRVVKQLVQSGSSYGDRTWVAEGLKPGDLVIDRGARRVIDQQIVKLTDAQ